MISHLNCLIKDQKVFLSGQHSGGFLSNGALIGSNGSQDGFIAVLDKNNLNSFEIFQSIGGKSYDEIISFTISDTGKIFLTGGFINSIRWGLEFTKHLTQNKIPLLQSLRMILWKVLSLTYPSLE